jgi:hypothetical protein
MFTDRGAEKYAPPKIRDLHDEAKPRSTALAITPPRQPAIEDTITRKGEDPIKAIQQWLQCLTHREMKTLCGKIFTKATGDTVTAADLPDLLDRFAYED